MSKTTQPNEPAVTEAPAEAKRPPALAVPDIQMQELPASTSAMQSPAPPPTPPRAAGDRGASRRATSDVPALRSFGLAIPFYGLALLLAKMAPPNARAILLERGWPPHATMALASLALAILLVKAFGLRRQRRAFALDLLPDGEPGIGPAAAARLVDHVESVRGFSGARSFLVERVLRVLSQYAAHGDAAEASAANEADADADAASVAASFSTVKVIVWSMPILGLIGTVVGLSGAVGAFSHAMSGAEQLDSIKDSLREVTTGLAVAFDATFVALVASILVMLPMTWLQKGEDKLVNDVDDYCLTHILPRLGGHETAGASLAEQAPAADEIPVVLLDTVAHPLAEMLAANARLMERMSEDRRALAGVEDALMAQFSAFAAALQQAAPAMERTAAQLERATAQMGSSVERAAAQLDRATAHVGPSVERVVAALDKSTAAVGPSIERAIAGLDRTTGQVTQGMERAVTQLERASVQVESRVAPSVERAAGQIERATAELGASVGRAVTQLEAATAVTEQAATAAERAQDQLSRELGASRQLLSLLAAGLGAGDASHDKPRHANGTHGANGTNGANGTSAARGA
jgi:biopolymer transport protein ExbB/TolQ